MKLILFTFLLLMSYGSFCQVSIIQPQLYYFSKRIYENSDWIKVGERVLFTQECSTDLPPEVPTGIVFFENVYSQKDQFSMAVEFKDTVIVSVTYYLKVSQKDLLKRIGYTDIKALGSATKGQWTYLLNEEKRRTVIVGDKKRIVIVQTIN